MKPKWMIMAAGVEGTIAGPAKGASSNLHGDLEERIIKNSSTSWQVKLAGHPA
jgi:hypothetical protein